MGTTGIILSMVESGFLDQKIRFEDPVRSLQQVSFDLGLKEPLQLTNGTTMTAIEVQWWFYEQAEKYVENFGTDHLGGNSVPLVLEWWRKVLEGLESPDNLEPLVGILDWVSKKHILDGFQERKKISSSDVQLAAICLLYTSPSPRDATLSRMPSSA